MPKAERSWRELLEAGELEAVASFGPAIERGRTMALQLLFDAVESLTPDAVARLVATPEFRELGDAVVAYRQAFKVGTEGDNGKV